MNNKKIANELNKIAKELYSAEENPYNLKKLTSAEKRLVSKLDVGTTGEVVSSSHNNRKVKLTPIAVAIFYYIVRSSLAERRTKEFDVARDIFVKNWPKEYRDLFD